MDLRTVPFRTMVVMGESLVKAEIIPDPADRWPNIVADLISRFQGEPVVLHKRGMGNNVISPRSPGYPDSRKPSALERYREDAIALRPDLFILSFGLCDMRSGTPPEQFCEDLRQIITEVKAACNPVTVLTTLYHMSAFDRYPPFNRGSQAASEAYNLAIRQLAEESECLLADIWAAQGQADWAILPDTVHSNELGHRLAGNRVFEAIATHCSVLARSLAKSTEPIG